MNKFLLLSLSVILIFLLSSGCRNTKYTTYYESGQKQSEYTSSGFINWSSGNNKNLPLSHINVQGIGL